MEKPFKVRWAIFAQNFEDLPSAMEFASRKVLNNECLAAEVVVHKTTTHGACSTIESKVLFSAKKSIDAEQHVEIS